MNGNSIACTHMYAIIYTVEEQCKQRVDATKTFGQGLSKSGMSN